ncbi:hypothetical protein ISS07_03945 [Candidatus Woesearchaeota archaeon]|nr:hypothetical protein [Candidatus Woesearchaeota archaeon]
MKKLIILTIIFSIFSIGVYADLADYPDFFIKANSLDVNIVVGNKAPATHVIVQTQLALALANEINKPATGVAKLASEIESIENRNIISIGNSCINEISKEILGQECGQTEGRIAIELYNSNGYNYIVLNADSDSDIKKLADTLVNYKDNNLEGDVFVLSEGTEKIPEPALYEEEIEEEIEEDERVTEEAKPTPELYDKEEVELEYDPEPEPILKEENNLIKNLISWFFSLFGK